MMIMIIIRLNCWEIADDYADIILDNDKVSDSK